MTIFPKEVNAAPLVEFRDLSAEMLMPPAGCVIVTLAISCEEQKTIDPRSRPFRRFLHFILKYLFARILRPVHRHSSHMMTLGWMRKATIGASYGYVPGNRPSRSPGATPGQKDF